LSANACEEPLSAIRTRNNHLLGLAGTTGQAAGGTLVFTAFILSREKEQHPLLPEYCAKIEDMVASSLLQPSE
jgi:hypothetical protein